LAPSLVIDRLLTSALAWVSQQPRPWLVDLILQLRPDLRSHFDIGTPGTPDGWLRFYEWLITAGHAEYRSLSCDPDFLSLLHRRHPPTKLSLLELLIYAIRKDVRAEHPVGEDVNGYIGWFERHGIDEHGLSHWFAPPPSDATATRPFGVNLIGYAFGQLGIGEDIRMAAGAMKDAGIPFSVVNFAPGPHVPQGDRSIEAHLRHDAPYSVNLVCLTAIEHGRFYAEHGRTLTDGRYNIGYWPWELSRWPDEWKGLTRLVDEVWVSSTHTFDALASELSVPVLLMPMAVDLGRVARRSRADFGLPQGARLFCFSFDLKSSIHRKNPRACVEAFLRAFPKGNGRKAPTLPSPRGEGEEVPEVGLVIKVHPPRGRNAAWAELKALAARDKRIHIVEETLSRPELLALYKACDCFVSLHRAEGFGRNIAEALALGLHVIATGYSGNMDFCQPPHCDLVRYRLVKVRKGQYPYGEGQVWAEPDVDHAAGLMRQFAARPTPRKRPALDKAYSVESVGQNYRLRLAQVTQKR
jgi:glycosyltransferase involved in cell wall biosynthesis